MQLANRTSMSVAGAAAVLGGWLGAMSLSCAAVEPGPSPTGDVVSGSWQHRKVTFNYYGITALYTCDGLETHVRQILLHIGARHDINVTATGCPGGSSTPSHNAWVTADFYSLVPAAGPDESGTVKARWSPMMVTPQQPYFMGDGDCELIQEMKDLITQNFTLRDIKYSTECVPRQLYPDAFAVRGQALKALPVKPGAVKG
ncbi:MAG TPA: hypothetical protein VKG63_06010 [Steroidobacteraceae bacterium]|nr:hypothetical protein [Steroidobacteraceae bacterium]